MEFIKKVNNPDKILLRREIKERWRECREEYLEAASRRIFAAVEACDEFVRAERVGLYAALSDEPCTAEFIARWAECKRLYFPVIEGDSMSFREFTGEWRTGHFCAEPTGEECDELDLIIVPAVAFDARGYRLGRGGGFYDRYLAAHHVPTIGVCYSFALLDSVPTEGHDCRVDKVIIG